MISSMSWRRVANLSPYSRPPRRLPHRLSIGALSRPLPLRLVRAAHAVAARHSLVGAVSLVARQGAAFEEGVELVLHEVRQGGSGSGFDLGEEGRGVLHQPQHVANLD